PNTFPNVGEAPEYNTVDATLWYFEAIRQYAEYSGDVAVVREKLLPVLTDIIDWHIRGTRYGIKVDPADGLLHAGEPGGKLTWMEQKIGGWVVTPGTGKPVEIQALWYSTLRTMQDFAGKFEEPSRAQQYAEMAERVRAIFNRQFWNEKESCLFDVV